jgi:hypothetical protein
MSDHQVIRIKGARQHNLRNLDVTDPWPNRLIGNNQLPEDTDCKWSALHPV